VAGVCVGDDGTEEVYEGLFGAFFGSQGQSCGTLFAVVEELGEEEMFYLLD